MAYLTLKEYLELGYEPIEYDRFKVLLKRASDVLNSVTFSFYEFNDLEKDVPFRKNRFKRALATQIEFFYEVDSMTSEGVNSVPQSISLGRTKITNQSTSNPVTGESGRKMICKDIFIHLSGTGLLNSGVG